MPLASLLLAASLVAAPVSDGPFQADDLADLEAFVARHDPVAPERIRARFESRIARLIEKLPKAPAPEKSDGRKTKKKRPPPKTTRNEDKKEEKRQRAALSEEAKQLEAGLISSAAAWRLCGLLRGIGDAEGEALWPRLASAPDFAVTLAFAMVPKRDAPLGVRAVAKIVLGEDGQLAERYPELAAAICVVHDDKNTSLNVNENTGFPPPPEAVWHYYVTNAARMRYGVEIAPELLIHVVDVPASEREVAWAFENYHDIPRVGALYEKVDYDYGVLKGEPKKSDSAGWNLLNIMKHGGVCADQAYFTSAVAKSLGIPAVYVSGADATVAHAWVEFAQTVKSNVIWDTEGRYEPYRGVAGRFRDPQTEMDSPDAVMPMLVQWGHEPRAERWRAGMLEIIDEHLAGDDVPDPLPGSKEARERKPKAPVTADTAEAREAILRMAIRDCPTDVRAWLRVQRLGAEKGLDLDETKAWLDDILALCGRSYPEMVFEVARPLIGAVKDVDDEHELWMRLADVLSKRGDLAGAALMQDANMWERAGKKERAGQTYELILRNYADAGPFVVQALNRAAALLPPRDLRRRLELHELTFNRITMPKDMPGIFGSQSTWYRVGMEYAEVLQSVGRERDADALRGRLKREVQPSKVD